ncbi:zinc ribbon domain-containing protein [uncultured Anaerococcus sp.]|uniref:zinc ribbon domain-containing protein n=1 Tax=uncultured Anaerococcus sp. TaxID=293428 RepID=UPI0025FE0B81|nr:zinc ribbon domain-containing protein [uncultured Anaerococcus sp.]
MNCEHCGAKIDEASNFCPVCGNKVVKAEPFQKPSENKENSDGFLSKIASFKLNKDKKESLNKDESEAKEDINSKSERKKEDPVENIENTKKTSKEEKNEESQKIEEKNLNQAKNPTYDMKGPSNDNEDETSEETFKTLENEAQNLADLKAGESFIEPDPHDRMDKYSRRFNNQGDTKSPFNQRSLIEEVQAKVNLNKKKKKNDENYYIEDKTNSLRDENLEKKLDRLIGDGDNDPSNVTLSEGIRNLQARNKKLNRDDRFEGYREIPLKKSDERKANSKSPVVREEDKDKASKNKAKSPGSKKYLTSRNVLLGLIGFLLALIMGILYSRMTRAEDITLPLSDYINISYEGEDGNATPRASIDTEKLISAYGDQIEYISKDNNKDSYESAAHEFASDLENGVVFQYSKDSGLSNGDEITVMANLDNIKLSDKYNVLVSSASKAVIIDGIGGGDYTDPFTYIGVEFEGESPEMTLTVKLTEDAPEFMHALDIIPGKSNGIEAGEEVAISLNFNEEELRDTYNVILNPTSKNFTAPGEGDNEDSEEKDEEELGDKDTDFIKTTAHLDSDLLGELKYKAGELINQTILYKNIINVDEVNYLGSFTGYKEDGDDKNNTYLIYEVNTSEKLPDSDYKSSFKYYTFVEYQNVKKKKDADGKFYSQGPITTDNQIFHKFFVESDYKYYQIEYQGFGFIDKALANVSIGLDGYDVKEDNKANISDHFSTSDNIVGEYEADSRRLSLRSDGSLVYQADNAIHLGSFSQDGNEISATIKGVNVDTPVSMTFDANILKVESQGEFDAVSFSKIESF